VDRRQFLRRGGSLAAAAGATVLFGCSPERSTGPTPSTGPKPEELDPAAWQAFAAALTGRLVLPADPAYATARLLYDPRFDAEAPAAVAYCATPTDVQRSIAFARTHGITPIARCGGHSYAGYSSGSGLVVDVTQMNGVAPGATGASGTPGTVTVGAGTLLVDLYDQLSALGVMVPGGSCPTVGISGLALGGGVGVLGRKYGLTCDVTESLDVVIADGRLLRCDASDHDDLYWACRGGGGGNFGIVTSFTFRAAPVAPLAVFTVDWPWAAAADVLGSWFSWQGQAPDELWSNCQLASGGAGGLAVRVNGVFVGSAGTLGSLVRALQSSVGSAPGSSFVGPEPYLHAMLVEAGCESSTVAQCHLPSQNPAGTLSRQAFVATSAYVSTTPSSAGLDAVVRAVETLAQTLPSLGGGLVFDAYGGAINAVAADATAFVHRHALCAVQASVSTGTGAGAVASGQAWLAQTMAALAPHTDGQAYQNYIDPTLADWAQAYYGANWARLVSVKGAVDPDDVFHFAQSIPTSR